MSFLKEEVWILEPPPGRGEIKWETWGYLEGFASEIETQRKWSILKARQLGFSWLLAAYAVWLTVFKRGAWVLMQSYRQDEATKLKDKAEFIYNHMSPELKPKVTGNNGGLLEFGQNLSGIEALPATDKAGSGHAVTCVIADEHAKQEYAEQAWAALEPTINAGAQFISCSSMFGVGTRFERTYRAAKVGQNNFTARFFGCFERPGRDEAW